MNEPFAVSEAKPRLGLIALANAVAGREGLSVGERFEMRDFIEALCRHYDLDVATCLSEPRRTILRQRAEQDFGEWETAYLIDRE